MVLASTRRDGVLIECAKARDCLARVEDYRRVGFHRIDVAACLGGDAGEAPRPEFGAASISLVEGGGPLFEGTPPEQTVWESHNDEVTGLPPGFKVVAHSDSCEIQGMENEALDRFGLQFHPEVNDTEFGARIFENFVEICKRARKTA